MADRMPTLKGLRAFEEAYLLRNYTAAARVLNVQQPAISYQIKRLEEDLGVVLFTKERGRLVPTQPANELFNTVSKSFDAIRSTSNKLRQSAAESVVTIATYPGIGTYWLSPRLPILSQALLATTKVVTLVNDADLMCENADCWILFGQGNWPRHDARMLIREEVCPVTAPGLAERIQSFPEGTVPKGVPIIELEDPESRWLNWEDWQRQTNGEGLLPTERTIVNDHGFALHLALSGAGIALAWLGTIEQLLSGGSLVRLSNDVATSEAGYWIVGRPGFFETDQGRTILEVLETPSSRSSPYI